MKSEIKFIKGNIFSSKMQTIVNTVNCVGIMGKGIALVFKLRYPSMFNEYQNLCKSKDIKIGKVWLYKETGLRGVLNFPTKFHWKYDSKPIYLEKGLQNFLEIYKENNITSIAFPLLGAHNGGLDPLFVKQLMTNQLSKCDIPIEIYEYDPNAEDDLFNDFKTKFLSCNFEEMKAATKLRKDKFQLIVESLNNPEIKSMIALLSIEGLGEATMQKCFSFVLSHYNNQSRLF
jgi:O-acetyl-ADP-ribose deacetylase (regulator of RNase III)